MIESNSLLKADRYQLKPSNSILETENPIKNSTALEKGSINIVESVISQALITNHVSKTKLSFKEKVLIFLFSLIFKGE